MGLFAGFAPNVVKSCAYCCINDGLIPCFFFGYCALKSWHNNRITFPEKLTKWSGF
ncbi:hypothetical protein DAQ1742_04386 [Dickeya aquatica]|uniref:Uncharacterized protein n=1 Tax=Dickeya aquatica TaxID=1401087 RepID=A0A375AGY2_9GAMM|nr:hypothetical protein DAQ1742_04386 [Dickeya aquatica]